MLFIIRSQLVRWSMHNYKHVLRLQVKTVVGVTAEREVLEETGVKTGKFISSGYTETVGFFISSVVG